MERKHQRRSTIAEKLRGSAGSIDVTHLPPRKSRNESKVNDDHEAMTPVPNKLPKMA